MKSDGEILMMYFLTAHCLRFSSQLKCICDRPALCVVLSNSPDNKGQGWAPMNRSVAFHSSYEFHPGTICLQHEFPRSCIRYSFPFPFPCTLHCVVDFLYGMVEVLSWTTMWWIGCLIAWVIGLLLPTCNATLKKEKSKKLHCSYCMSRHITRSTSGNLSCYFCWKKVLGQLVCGCVPTSSCQRKLFFQHCSLLCISLHVIAHHRVHFLMDQ